MFTPLLAAIGDFNFLYASGVLFVTSVAIVYGVSMATKAPDESRLKGLTYATNEEGRREIRESWDRLDVIATVVILGLVAAIYTYFSFWI